MLKNLAKTTTLLTASAIALAAVATNVAAQAGSNTGYLQDTRGAVIKDPFNLCYRTGYWSPAMAIAECDPDLVPKPAPTPKPAPPPPPKPAAVPPKPAPKPAPVPVIQKITMSADAHFDFDKAVLRPEGRTKLDDLVAKLKGVNLEVIIAVGHADRIGSNAYNNKLSLRRADAVKTYLVGKGIPANRVYAEGKGKKQPVTKPGQCKGPKSPKVIACLQPDRRVEIEVVGTQQK